MELKVWMKSMKGREEVLSDSGVSCEPMGIENEKDF